MERKNLCKKCKVHCCKYPVFTTDEYIRLFKVIGNEVGMKAEPELLGNVWQFKQY